jgi:hypothetical protein
VASALDGSRFEYVFPDWTSGPFGEDIPLPWLSYDATIQKYKKIFREYRWFGDNVSLPKRAVRKLSKLGLGYAGPGWYDTHACL